MLAVYTFVFSTVFKARWPGNLDERPIGFAINLFAGLIVFALISECLTKAPGLVLANPSYVKKIVFPLEVLGYVTVASALFHAVISALVLICFELVENGSISSTVWMLPLIWFPLILLSLATTWMLSALGVYLRDVNQAIGSFISMLMFVSPIFFPLTALPERWQTILRLNPLAHIIDQTRTIMIAHRHPSLAYIFWGISLGMIACEVAFKTFAKAKRGFADVM